MNKCEFCEHSVPNNETGKLECCACGLSAREKYCYTAIQRMTNIMENTKGVFLELRK